MDIRLNTALANIARQGFDVAARFRIENDQPGKQLHDRHDARVGMITADTAFPAPANG